MPRTFFTSDHHFGHANILKYCPERPFEDVGTMNLGLIANWNSKVADDDVVYVLGDFGFGSFERLASIVARLHGTKVLLMGNHDRHSRGGYLRMGFSEVLGKTRADKVILRDIPDLGKVYLSHYPPKEARDRPTLCGHVHQNWKIREDLRAVNIGVDVWDFMPIPTSDLLAKIVADLRPMTDEEREAQRRSFVYGQTKMSNPEVTQELVAEVGDIQVMEPYEALRKRPHLYAKSAQDLVQQLLDQGWESVIWSRDGKGVQVRTTARSIPGGSFQAFFGIQAPWPSMVFSALSENLEITSEIEGELWQARFSMGLQVGEARSMGPWEGRFLEIYMRPDPGIFGDFQIGPV